LKILKNSPKEEALYAVLTDGETRGSPCSYSSGTAVPYREGDDKITLYGRWMDDYSSDDPAEYFPGIDRAWIITETIMRAGKAAWIDADYGRDSISDAVSSAVLSMYKNMAIKTIHFPPQPGEDELNVDDSDSDLALELLSKIDSAYQAYRRTKDGGRVRMSFAYRGRPDPEIWDLLLGAWCDEPVQEALLKDVANQTLTPLPYPPRQLLLQHLRSSSAPFKAILYKQKHRGYTDGVAYKLLCEKCLHKPSFRCSLKPDEEFDHLTEHKLDEHVLLQIDNTPIANEDELLDWLEKDKILREIFPVKGQKDV
jgi:hypothetical protein